MKKFIVFGFLLLFISQQKTFAQATPYWATDIAPIFYANCTKCHNPNGIAPFSLITYADAFPEINRIDSTVQAGIMPPWPPDTNYSRFCGERKLSSTQIQTIVDWVAQGAQPGNLSSAPPAPVYSSNAQLTNPDLVSQMPLYTVNCATDLYRCFVMQNVTSTNEYITKIEVIPGNRPVVHHVLIYQDQASTCINLDNNDPGPGYTWFGDVGSPTATLVAGWVPGEGVYELPANMGILLHANANLIMQVHYPGGTFNQVDSTQVRFTFASGTVRSVTLSPLINYWSTMTDGPLYIPADSVKTFHAQWTTNFNGTFISAAPHMHLIGKNITNYAVTPTQDTVPLIQINDWNFHWQGFYNFPQLVHLPYGSKIYAHALYDNTTNNPQNPNQTNPIDVSAGENTTDEMMIVYYAFLPYQPGDENIMVDSSVLAVPQGPQNDIVKTPQLYDVYPSPAATNSSVTVPYFMPEAAEVRIEIYGIDGKLISVPVNSKNVSAGFGKEEISTAGLAPGNYFIRMTSGQTVRTKKLVVE